MKLVTKTRNDEGGLSSTFYEIPNSTVAGGAIILTIIQTLATLLGSYLSNIPKQQNDQALNRLREKNFTVQVLQRVLENPDSINRSNSLQLLISAGVLQDSENKILEIAKVPSRIPKWQIHPLEPVFGNIGSDLKSDQVLPQNKSINNDSIK
ncbi:hypothetical protein FO440_07465 [Mucilaginibacter corticis]|uniref:Uncharacterized protein n=1 Tax=Mucilaginibacter corticis TaxID=2597670 RepID=A0A556MVP1_9SPHI|nr:hypothetical protein [Mucilaginibacter corticis]TSJ44004.1 hypothetical protein FO440_07465 [Mucilaginibacter corticis]